MHFARNVSGHWPPTGDSFARSRGDPLVCCFAVVTRWRFVCIFAKGKNYGSPRSSPRRRRSSAPHLFFRISAGSNKKDHPKGWSFLLVTRWRFELQTHCLKGVLGNFLVRIYHYLTRNITDFTIKHDLTQADTGREESGNTQITNRVIARKCVRFGHIYAMDLTLAISLRMSAASRCV